jgi:hypothetical protein
MSGSGAGIDGYSGPLRKMLRVAMGALRLKSIWLWPIRALTFRSRA